MVPIGSPITTPQDPAEVWNASAWTTYDKITIDASQVDSTLSDFPIYVDLSDLSDSFWNTTDGNYPGVDIRVTTDDGSPIELPRELVSISTTTKTGELHFKANNISSTTDTTFRIYYNGTTTTEYTDSSTYGANNVWTNGYLGVWHLGEDGNSTAGGYKDSTGNGNDGTGTSMTSSSDVSGKLGTAQDFDGVNDYIKVNGLLGQPANITLSAWAEVDTRDTKGVTFASMGDSFLLVDQTSNSAVTGTFRHSSGWRETVGTDNIVGSPWSYNVYTFNDVANEQATYVGKSGISDLTVATSSFTESVAYDRGTDTFLGKHGNADAAWDLNGRLDEVRIASTTRSAAWVKAEYTNQKETAGFYRVNRDVAQTWNVNAWTTYDTITISASKVDANLTDFPVYVDLANLSADFWSITDAKYPGVDIRVTTDDGTPIELPRELVAASSTAKTGELHFKANSISSTTDTTFRVYYNGTTTIDYKDNSTYGANNVWTNGYVGVWHLQKKDGLSSKIYKDSTLNGYDAILMDDNNVTVAVSSPVGQGIDFTTADTDYMKTGVLSDKLIGTKITLTGWTYSPNLSSSHATYFGLRDGNSADDFYILQLNGTNNIEARFTNSAGTTYDVTSPTPSVVGNQWNHSALILDGTNLTYYDNGTKEGSITTTGSYNQTDSIFTIAAANNGGYSGDTSHDEVRLASVSRSPAWVKAEYTNQSNTRDFYSVNGEGAESYSAATSTATWVVPAGVTEISVKAWGAGGGGGSTNSSSGGAGGGAGFVEGTIAVTPGETLTLKVGGAGKAGLVSGGSGVGGLNGGGAGGPGCTSYCAGGGGGYSGIFRESSPLFVAAGGGGGGVGYGSVGGSGGVGGGIVGGSGGLGAATGAAGGGSQSAGGIAGIGNYGNGNVGAYLSGANGIFYSGTSYGSGAGGGGYYGGGSGAGATSARNGGGGGGSSFATSTATATSTSSGSGTLAGNNVDGSYVSGVGTGGTPAADGGDGLLIIIYSKKFEINIDDSAGGQVSNAFTSASDSDVELFSFQLSSSTASVDLKEINISLSGANKISASNFSNIALYKDVNNNAVFDSGIDTLISTSTPVFTGKNGQINFGVDLTIAGVSNYLVVGDTSDIPVGGYITFALNKSGISKRNIVAIGNVSAIQHIRNSIGGRSFYSGGGSVGGNAPAGDGDVGGGGSGGGTGSGSVDTNTNGDTIGNEPDFNWPSAHSGAWTNAANAYDQVDGTYATAASAISNEFKNYTHGVPASDTIVGIEVKLEVSGTTAAGNIAVALSWNQGSSWTETKSTPTLTTTDAVVTLGGSSDTWGRTWTADEFSNANFSLKVTASQSANTLRIDAIQVKVYHQASGGGGGGGGGI